MSDTAVTERATDAPRDPADRTTDATDGSVDEGAAWRSVRASLAAVADGALAAVVVLGVLSVVALTGWFSADAGLRWEPRAALRVAADAWALGQGASLLQAWGAVTVVPLGVTLLSVLAARRAGRRVASRAVQGVSDADVATAGALLLGGYLVVTMVVVVLAGAEETGPSLFRALLGATLVVAVGAGPALVAGTGRGPAYAASIRGRVPEWLPGAVRRAGIALVVLVGVAAMLLGALLLRHADAGAAAVSALDASTLDALVVGVACLLVLPNLVVWTSSWLVGPGVVVGTGTLVAPTGVALGPVPAVPFVAALPTAEPPAWVALVQLSPVLAGLLAVLLLRRSRPLALTAAVAQAVVVGLGTGGALALLGLVASGSAGPGRLADVGVPVVGLFLTTAAATGLGAVLGVVLLAVRDRLGGSGAGGGTDTVEIVVETGGTRAFTPDGWRTVVPAGGTGARRPRRSASTPASGDVGDDDEDR